MAVKVIIDTARAAPGYAGLAIFSGEEIIYADQVEQDYVLRLRALYLRPDLKTGAGEKCLCAVAAGFTFHVYPAGGLVVVLRLSGRFAARPQLPTIEYDYVEPLADAVLPSRAGVRREAEALLRQYDLLD